MITPGDGLRTMAEPKSHENELPRKMLTVRDIAFILNIHSSTVRRWEKEGLLKSYRIGPGHSLRFGREDILDFVGKSRNGVHGVVV
jgi:excisionase family DNA binding protein